jgi:hypothetical protein
MIREDETDSFVLRSARYVLALMLGTLIIVKGVELIGTDVGVGTRTLIGATAGVTVVLVSGSPVGWFLEIILFIVCCLYLNLPFNANTIGAQLDIAHGLIGGWALSYGFIIRLNEYEE